MSLSEAMQELKAAVIKGSDFDDKLFDEVAADYGLNPKLLVRKVEEAGWTVEKLRAIAEITSPEVVFGKKLEAILEKEKSRLMKNETGSRFTVFVYKGETYTYLGSYTGSEHLCVAHSNAVKYVLNSAALRHSTFEVEAAKKMKG